jgi:hypothetical protein
MTKEKKCMSEKKIQKSGVRKGQGVSDRGRTRSTFEGKRLNISNERQETCTMWSSTCIVIECRLCAVVKMKRQAHKQMVITDHLESLEKRAVDLVDYIRDVRVLHVVSDLNFKGGNNSRIINRSKERERVKTGERRSKEQREEG